MKKFLIPILLIMVLVSLSLGSTIHTRTVISARTVAASGTYTSAAISFTDLRKGDQPDGYFSLQVAVTGSGTAKFEYFISNDGVNYIEPTTASDIATGFTATSGPSGDGKNIYSFTPEPCAYMKIKVTETGTSDSVVVTANLMFS